MPYAALENILLDLNTSFFISSLCSCVFIVLLSVPRAAGQNFLRFLILDYLSVSHWRLVNSSSFARPTVKSSCVSEVEPSPQPHSLPPLWDTSHVNGSWNGEPAVLFLPSHVQVTKQQRYLKEKAIINLAEIASERLVLFSGLEDSDPRGQQWRLSF